MRFSALLIAWLAAATALAQAPDAAPTEETVAGEREGTDAPLEPTAAVATTPSAPPADAPSADAPSAADPADGAKVAVIVAGDPDEALRRAARDLDRALAGTDLVRPSDSLLRAALRGEVPPDGGEDGLERVRAERRRLGFGDADPEALRALGGMVGADALVIVRRADGALRIEVFDVPAARFYRDRLALDPAAETVVFIRRAARASRRRAARVEVATVDDPPPAPSPAQTAEAAAAAEEPAEAVRPVRAWFKKNWAFLVAGALLVGVVTAFVVRAAREEPQPDPMIVFRPGG